MREVAALTVEEIRVWSRTAKVRSARSVMQLQRGASPHACDCDVLTTATPSTTPLVMAEWIHEGTHINAIGADAPGKQELDPVLLQRLRYPSMIVARLSIPARSRPISTGRYNPDRIAGTLGEVVIGKKKRSSPDAITIFDSTGLAIQDLAIAALAIQNSEGYELPFP